MRVHGECDGRFKELAEEFERNFVERGEIGASVCVVHEGERVVDLWGGIADVSTQRPWEQDTIGIVQSCTKGAVALCAHILVSRGQLDLDAPVSTYWPEFAQAGKEHIPVWWVLSHLDAIPVISAEQKVNAVLDWDSVTADLAAQAPFWKPGTRPAYHGFSFGYLVGEIVRRVSQRSVGTFFREEVAEPLGLDFWIGLPPEHHARLAPSVDADPADPGEPLHPVYAAMAQPGTIQALLFMNGNGYFEPGGPDRPESLVAELPSTGGVTNARGLAEMYAPLSLGGARGAVRLVEPHDVARMGAVRAAAIDAMLLHPIRFTLGFWGSIDNRRSRIGPTDSVIMSEDAFGHPGMGGRIGFADPGGRFSFGYTMNKMGPGTTVNPRGQSLIDAAYRALGYSEDRQGTWAR